MSESKYLDFEGLKKYDKQIKKEIETLISFDEDQGVMIIGSGSSDGELPENTGLKWENVSNEFKLLLLNYVKANL